MPNKISAKKRVRRSKKQKTSNDSLRTKITKAVKAIGKLSAKKAADSLPNVQSLLAKAAKKGVIHKKTAARKTSRLAKKMVK
jgi:small subunit ribosomal protein S20